MACLTRLITNHIPIGEYRLRLFPNEPLDCPCQKAEIETRQHSLFNCERFKKSWNPKRESIFDILTFLELNPGAFSFQDSLFSYFSYTINLARVHATYYTLIFLLFTSFPILYYLSSLVATTVCHHASHNKTLIFLTKTYTKQAIILTYN